jgi:hypothetical protein
MKLLSLSPSVEGRNTFAIKAKCTGEIRVRGEINLNGASQPNYYSKKYREKNNNIPH